MGKDRINKKSILASLIFYILFLIVSVNYAKAGHDSSADTCGNMGGTACCSSGCGSGGTSLGASCDCNVCCSGTTTCSGSGDSSGQGDCNSEESEEESEEESLILTDDETVISSDSADSITVSALVNGVTVKTTTCTNDNSCTLTGLNQQDCCWAQNSCTGGGYAGTYEAYAYITHTLADGSITIVPRGPEFMFYCYSDGTSCSTYGAASCIGKYCVHDYCRSTATYCGDTYCDTTPSEETCPSATRTTDLQNCDDDSTACKIYVCEEGCSKEDLPAGRYEDSDYPYSTSYMEDSWECYDCEHCDGEGECIEDCVDVDADGYGDQPDSLYDPSCCTAGSSIEDCNDTSANIYPGAAETFCDCNSDDGYTAGATEGPINLGIPLSSDFCFDRHDNDCDTYSDCDDTGCSPNGYLYPIYNRSCYNDCTSDYASDLSYDRACCPRGTDCVIDGACIEIGDTSGGSYETHLCYNNQWYGGDSYSSVCRLVLNDSDYDPTIYPHWNLSGDAGDGKCCGDDEGEYFVVGIFGSYGCCSDPDFYFVGGICTDTLYEKSTWDNSQTAYCMEDTDCLVNPSNNDFSATSANATDISTFSNNNVRCIDTGDFIGDHYCNDGDWTTRTAMIATQLINIGQNYDDATLFCDTYSNVLNYYSYAVGDSYAEYLLGTQGYGCSLGTNNVQCVNNVCVLKYNEGDNEGVIFGTSLNHNINSSTYSILQALGGTSTSCSSQTTSTSFSPCSANGIYYNNAIKSVIYSNGALSMTNVLGSIWFTEIQSLYSSLINYVTGRTTTTFDFSYAQNTKNFDKLYIAQSGDKTIKIITETVGSNKYMAISYSGFDSDICSMINSYKQSNSRLAILNCSESGDTTYVYTGGTSTGYYSLVKDLGPKLRLQ